MPADRPTDDVRPWALLAADEKRARVLEVAGELFAREGVDFPMPELAKAAGIGVGSIYRQIGTKDEILAELVIARLGSFQEMFEQAAGTAEPVGALWQVVSRTLDLTLEDRVAKISFDLALDNTAVRAARQTAVAALQQLLDEAKAAGGLRSDATTMDLRMMFRLAREAERLNTGGGRRLATLVIAGLSL